MKNQIVKDSYLEEDIINSEELILRLINIKKGNPGCYFRGVSDAEYKLEPSIFREPAFSKLIKFKSKSKEDSLLNFLKSEIRLIDCFYSESNHVGLNVPTFKNMDSDEDTEKYINDNIHNWLPKDTWVLTGLMQHYGLPTRFLDWSSNPLIACYFAIQVSSKKLELFFYAQPKPTDKFISIYVINKNHILSINKFLESRNLNHLGFKMKFVEIEKCNNVNISAQKGIFTMQYENISKNNLNLKYEKPLPLEKYIQNIISNLIKEDKTFFNFITDNIKTPILYKFNLNYTQILELRHTLTCLDFDSASLFPGFNGVSKLIKETVLLD